MSQAVGRKREREGSADGRAGSAFSHGTSSAEKNAASAAAKTERNRKQKLRKRSKKQTANARIQRKAERRRGGNADSDDEDEDDQGVDSRQEMEAMLLDGNRVEVNDNDATQTLQPAKKSRDFTSDLKLYLDQWQSHHRAVQEGNAAKLQYSPWKFNKVLQSWALDHCADKDVIPLDLFKQLLLYIATVQGAARERLRDSMLKYIEEKEQESDPSEETAAGIKRAKKVLVAIVKSDK